MLGLYLDNLDTLKYRPLMLQYDRYGKWINNAKAIANFHNIYIAFGLNKLKIEQQNKKANINILARAGNRTLDLSHRSLICYL